MNASVDECVHVFVDEYGNKGLKFEKDGVTNFFVLTAVFVFSDFEDVREGAEKIRSNFFQTGEMKSSRVAENDRKRIEILDLIAKLKVKTFSVLVDKRELDPKSGLGFGKSFFKYLSGLLYKKIYDAHPAAKVVADKHGTEAFMLSFETYLRRQRELKGDLFFQPSFRFEDSKAEVLLQVADMVSGSWARCFDQELNARHVKEIAERLRPISLGVEVWPPKYSLMPQARQNSSEHDDIVREQCIRRAAQFVAGAERNESSQDEAARAQVEVLRLLLFTAQFGDDREYISTHRIIKHLRSNAHIDLQIQQIRSSVVAKLRDADVIIASGKKGYKLPVRMADILEFVGHAATIVPPMLSRLNRARSCLALATGGQLDILAGDEFSGLRSIADSVPISG